MQDSTPLVTAVIPTRNRPDLVQRAVLSALKQTFADLEVVVVVDGPDPETITALEQIKDQRLRVVALAESVGGAEARNVGVREARGEWIALLDDDDEWFREKLSLQLEAAQTCKQTFAVVTSRLIARRPGGDEVWPHRQMRDGEPMSEYLLCREASVRQGEGFIQSSTLLVPRQLMLLIPFASGLPRHQDWDWLIRASAHPSVKIVWVWQPLVIYYIDGGRKSVASGGLLAPSTEWINGNQLITPKARAYFYATQIAVRCHSLGAFFSVIRNTLRYPRALLIALGLTLAPRSLVNQFRSRDVISHA